MSRWKVSKLFLPVLLTLFLIISGMLTAGVAAADKVVTNKPVSNNVVTNKPVKDIKTAVTNAKTQNVSAKTLSATAVAKTEEIKEKIKKKVKEGLITDIRWSNHVDAITGEEKIRVVVDTSSPVKTEDMIASISKNQLTVIIKGVKPQKLKANLKFDGKIANKATVSIVSNKDTKIVFDLPEPITYDDYNVFTLSEDQASDKPFRVVIDIKKPLPLPNFSFSAGLKDKVIAIDPGHGGSDPGAIGPSKTTEKQVALAVANIVKTLLEKEGSRVIMTRSDDRDVYGANSSASNELGARVGIANNRMANVFVSIHADSFTNNTVGGTSTFYYQKTLYDAMLATSVQKRLLAAGGLQDRRANSSNFYVVKNTRMPAVLVELAFISNPKEEQLLKSPAFQQKMAKGIVDGIKDFFEQAEQAAKLRGDK